MITARMTGWLKNAVIGLSLGFALVGTAPSIAQPPEEGHPVRFEDAERLSAFGERAAYSPDGKRIAFIGKSYGDAFEIELVTGKVRNLTVQFPHQGFLRISYLPNGDYLLTGPHKYVGPNSRVATEMYVLDRSLTKGLQPLGESAFEGIAISGKSSTIAWQTFDPPLALKQNEPWMAALTSPMKRYIADITYRNGVPAIVNKRQIMPDQPAGCRSFVEFQDFRDHDKELVFYCGDVTPQGGYLSYAMGYRLDSGEVITYSRRPDVSTETEGIAPDGSWDAVECAVMNGPGLPPLDICKLEMKPNGRLEKLIVGTIPGGKRSISDPVVSPDGKWVAFQMSMRGTGELGEGMGIYRIRIAQ